MGALDQLPEYVRVLAKDSPALQRAVEDGVDLTLLLERLQWTPTQRFVQHQQALVFFEELRKAGQRKRGEL